MLTKKKLLNVMPSFIDMAEILSKFHGLPNVLEGKDKDNLENFRNRNNATGAQLMAKQLVLEMENWSILSISSNFSI